MERQKVTLSQRQKDIRSNRTEQALKSSLVELLRKKTFRSITIHDICEKAQISRTTFYLHFADKYELATYIVSDTQQELAKLHQDDGDAVMNGLLRLIDENKRAFYHLIGTNGDAEAIRVMYDWFVNDFVEKYTKMEQNGKKFEVPIKVISVFYAAGFASIINWWVSGNFNYSKDELEEYIHIMQKFDPYKS